MSKIEVNQISSQCGSTLTIGQSGDTIQLACGATQSGFGRTGTVDWDTTAKTASFTAVSGNGYFVNTTSGAITVTLPASPSAGDIVAVSDYAQTSGTNNITLARNGSNIEGNASDLIIQNNGVSMTFVYVDATKGWKVVNAGAESDKEPVPEYIVATGGTITCCGDYKIHTFTSPGTFTVCSVGNPAGSDTVDYMVIAGGGAGGGIGPADTYPGGGGGAGGYRESSGAASGCYTRSPLGACVSALPVTAIAFPITVGGGGGTDSNGSNSIFSTITSTGGGKGARNIPANSGGSGGGSSYNKGNGAGNTPPVSPPQGNPGGNNTPTPQYDTGGGGGATAVGGAPGTTNGDGGAGATSSINGTPTARAGGGGGGSHTADTTTGGSGVDGGGNGAPASPPYNGGAGTANTGGGGGGAARQSGVSTGTGGSGGSGIVIIRYKYQ